MTKQATFKDLLTSEAEEKCAKILGSAKKAINPEEYWPFHSDLTAISLPAALTQHGQPSH